MSCLWATALLPMPLLLAIEPASAAAFRCSIDTKFYCSQINGCDETVADVWNLIDMDRSSYSSCDRPGCDTYTATFSQSGLMTVIEVPGRGILAKLHSETGDLTKVTTSVNDAYLSFGKCELF